MKLFDHEFFFKHIATRHFDFLTVICDSVLIFNRLHSSTSLADNSTECCPVWSWTFFNSKKEEKMQYKEKKLLCSH